MGWHLPNATFITSLYLKNICYLESCKVVLGIIHFLYPDIETGTLGEYRQD